MVVLRRSCPGVPVSAHPCDASSWISNSTAQTKTGTVNGYLWKRWPRQSITYKFNAEIPVHPRNMDPPYVDIEDAFFFPTASQPEVFDTVIRADGRHTLLISSYFDTRLAPNPNLKRDFPHYLAWRGRCPVYWKKEAICTTSAA